MKRLTVNALVALSLAFAGCSHALAPPAVPAMTSAAVDESASQVRLHVSGSLAYASDVAKLTAAQRGFSGPFTFTTSNSRVIELLSAPPPAYASTSIKSPDGVIWAYASGPGTVTITVRSANTSMRRSFVVVKLGRVDVDPASLNFFGPTNGKGKLVAVSQRKFTGKFGENDDCKGFATVRAQSNAHGEATYLVKPGGIGTCQAWFEGGGRRSESTLAISVQP